MIISSIGFICSVLGFALTLGTPNMRLRKTLLVVTFFGGILNFVTLLGLILL